MPDSGSPSLKLPQCTNYSDTAQIRSGEGAGTGRRQIKLQNVSNQIILYVTLSDE